MRNGKSTSRSDSGSTSIHTPEVGPQGMQRFDQHLLELYNQKLISGTEAMKHATNPEALALRGIRQSGG